MKSLSAPNRITNKNLLDKVDTALDTLLDHILSSGTYEVIQDDGPGGSTRTHQIYHTIGLSELRALRKDLAAVVEVPNDGPTEADILELYP